MAPSSDTKARDYRRLNHSHEGPGPKDPWIGALAERDLVGDAMVGHDLDPDTRGVGLDRYERDIEALLKSTPDFRNRIRHVGETLGLGMVGYDPVRNIGRMILPSPEDLRRFDRQVAQAKALVTLSESGTARTGRAGAEALKLARKRLALLSDPQESLSGGGLVVGMFRPAKSLGSRFDGPSHWAYASQPRGCVWSTNQNSICTPLSLPASCSYSVTRAASVKS